jgi:hypothetical protein
MADFTMELRHVLEIESDIGLNDYPIFDEAHRTVLNQKIIDHFYNREICTETISLFRLFMRRKMHEIMPFWNQQYEATRVQFNALQTMAVKTVSGTEATGTVATEGESTAKTDAKSRAVSSVLPQQMLSGNGDYADNAQDNISGSAAEGTSTESQTTANTGKVDSETTGYQGNPAILIAEWRATMVNTDMDVINQLETLFMGVWGTTDNEFEGTRAYGYYGLRGGFGF